MWPSWLLLVTLLICRMCGRGGRNFIKIFHQASSESLLMLLLLLLLLLLLSLCLNLVFFLNCHMCSTFYQDFVHHASSAGCEWGKSVRSNFLPFFRPLCLNLPTFHICGSTKFRSILPEDGGDLKTSSPPDRKRLLSHSTHGELLSLWNVSAFTLGCRIFTWQCAVFILVFVYAAVQEHFFLACVPMSKKLVLV